MNLFLHKKKAARPRREGRNINDVVKVTLSITTPFYLWWDRKKCIDGKVVDDGGDASSIPIPDCSCIFPFGLLLDITLGVIQTSKSIGMMCCRTEPHCYIIFTVAWSWWETEEKWMPPIGGGVMQETSGEVHLYSLELWHFLLQSCFSEYYAGSGFKIQENSNILLGFNKNPSKITFKIWAATGNWTLTRSVPQLDNLFYFAHKLSQSGFNSRYGFSISLSLHRKPYAR